MGAAAQAWCVLTAVRQLRAASACVRRMPTKLPNTFWAPAQPQTPYMSLASAVPMLSRDAGSIDVRVVVTCTRPVRTTYPQYTSQPFPTPPPGGLRHKLRVCAALQGQVLQFSTDPYGCRVIQKLLEVRPRGNKYGNKVLGIRCTCTVVNCRCLTDVGTPCMLQGAHHRFGPSFLV